MKVTKKKVYISLLIIAIILYGLFGFRLSQVFFSSSCDNCIQNSCPKHPVDTSLESIKDSEKHIW